MKYMDRPIQINTILKTISAHDDTDFSTELETYIGDLESKQPDRPTRIVAILSQIETQYPAEMGISLETYISELEARQQTVASDNNFTPSWDANNPPLWSHARVVRREQQIRQRAVRKQGKS